MFAKIKTGDDALKTIKFTSIIFFVVAAFSFALVIADVWIPGIKQTFLSEIVAGIFWLVLALWLRFGKSRAAATILLIFSGINFALLTLVALPILTGEMASVGSYTTIISLFCLAAITTYAAVRAIEATFKLHGRLKGVKSL